MKIILTKDVNSLGKAGEVVIVKDGYARNYLLPKDLARQANKKNIAAIATAVEQASIQEAKKTR